MKIIAFDLSMKVLDVIEKVYKINFISKSRINFNINSELSGISSFFVLKDDSFEVQIGDTIVKEDVMEEYKDVLKGEVNKNVDAACATGFTSQTTGHFYDTAYHDQTNFSRRYATVLGKPAMNEIPWKIGNGSVIIHTREEFLEVCDELDIFMSSKINKGWIIKETIKNASSFDELLQIDLTVE